MKFSVVALAAAGALVVPATIPTAAAQDSSLNTDDWLSSLGSSEGELSSGVAGNFSSGALSSDLSSAGDFDTALRAWHQRFSFNQGSSDAALGTVFGILGAGGSSAGLVDMFRQDNDGYPLPLDESIADAALVSKEPNAEFGDRYEKWTVASPSMKRNVGVDVIRPADPTQPGPLVYFFEGVDGPTRTHFISNRKALEVFDDTNATILFPTQGAGSMWTDWEHDDPALGRNKWETFITQELDPIAVAETANFDGKRATMGLSMGASAAVMMANKVNKERPGFFNATSGISGCYSTLDTIGRGTAQLTVSVRGGDTTNMWGPFGSDAWAARDVVRDPSGLRDATVYVHAATGALGPADRAHYADRDFTDQLGGSLLEAGSYQCTKNLSAALTAAGIAHTADYKATGAHDWHEFEHQLAPAWAAIRGSLES